MKPEEMSVEDLAEFIRTGSLGESYLRGERLEALKELTRRARLRELPPWADLPSQIISAGCYYDFYQSLRREYGGGGVPACAGHGQAVSFEKAWSLFFDTCGDGLPRTDNDEKGWAAYEKLCHETWLAAGLPVEKEPDPFKPGAGKRRSLTVWIVCEHGRDTERCCVKCYDEALRTAWAKVKERLTRCGGSSAAAPQD